MKQAVIFDDGISYFTDPSQIQQVYGRFWDEGIPIGLAITPALRGDVKSPKNKSQYYGGIAPEKRGVASPFKVTDNRKLCNYLNVMAEQRLVEICLRGYNGNVDEFGSNDDVLLQQKIEEGMSELHAAFPSAEINTFIVPETTFSKTASQILVQYAFHISAYQTSSPNGTGSKSPLNHERTLFHYGDVIFTDALDPERQLKQSLSILKSHDFAIIRQNYWRFYDEGESQTNSLFDYWKSLVSELLIMEDLEIDTFTFI